MAVDAFAGIREPHPNRAPKVRDLRVKIPTSIYTRTYAWRYLRGKTPSRIVEEALAAYLGLLPTQECPTCGVRFDPNVQSDGRPRTHCERHIDPRTRRARDAELRAIEQDHLASLHDDDATGALTS